MAGRLVGSGAYRYRPAYDWPALPGGWTLDHPGAAAVSGTGAVYVLARNDHHPVTVWTQQGTFLRAWGAGRFSNMPHGICIGPDEQVWITDRDCHTVTQYSPTGEAGLVLGQKLRPSPTCDGRVVKSRPFNMPTNIAFSESGEIFAADGYGNHKVHRFAADGTLQCSWGRQGSGPGEFALVHNVALDRHGRVFICDDENDRVQIFDRDGGFLEQWRFANPSGICIHNDLVYISELQPFRTASSGPGRCRVSIWSLDGVYQAGWRGTDDDIMRGGHDLCVDARGDIYLCEGHDGRVVKFVRDAGSQ